MENFTFSLHNFRSFDSDGIILGDIQKINLFIGKNNAGKSNVLKFLYHLNQKIVSKADFPTDIKNQYKRNGLAASINIHISQTALKIPISFPAYDSNRNTHIHLKYADYLSEKLIFKFDCNENIVQLDDRLISMRDEGHVYLSNILKYPSHTHDIRDATKKYFNKIIFDIIRNYFRSVIYIPDLRFISEGNTAATSSTALNGANIISELFKMKNPKMGEESKKIEFDNIVRTIKNLLSIDDLELNIPHDKGEIILNSYGNQLPLSNYGSGIHELILLICGLLLHPKAIICLEEPELHLHPELQKKFFDFLFINREYIFY